MHSSPVFARQEAIALTGCTSNRLQFLERAKLIMPHRIGKSKKPVVMYTWEQIIAIKILDKIRTRPKITKAIVLFIVTYGIQNDRLLLLTDRLFWVSEDMGEIAQAMHAIGIGESIAYVNLVMVPVMVIVRQVLEQAKVCDAVDYAEVLRRVP